MKKQIVCFGAGKIGKIAYYAYKGRREIVAYVDNNEARWGSKLLGVPVISFAEYLNNYSDKELVITCGTEALKQIKFQLEAAGVKEYSLFKDEREVLVSYSHSNDREDLILWHVLRKEKDIFYIDIGCNDPALFSVTKLFYDKRGAHGINVDAMQEMIDEMNAQRSRDINICACVSDRAGEELKLHLQGESSTFAEKNVADSRIIPSRKVLTTTLKDICEQNISSEKDISFLKIDVEGFEKEVLLGADLNKYRPWIVVMESTEPNTTISNHAEWEHILIGNDYHLAFEYGVNRYYVADERKDLDKEFIPVEEMVNIYNVYELKACEI